MGLVLIAIIVLIILGGVYGYYRRGPRMDINQHPRPAGREGAAGDSDGSSRISGAAPENEGTFDTRGTR
jgi:hypothetical protein